MRPLLFALMIALLTLRGWMGDAMATEMALVQLQNPQFASKSIVDGPHETGAQTYFLHETGSPVAFQDAQDADGCAGHSHDHPSHAVNAGCDSCAVCQIGHTSTLSTMADSSTILSARAPRPAAATAFTSADAAPGQKPPIF